MKKDKRIIIAVIAVAIVVIALIVIFVVNGNDRELTCSRTDTPVDGFSVSENLEMSLAGGKISKISLEKKITVDGEFSKFDTYFEIIEDSLNSAYTYLSEDELSIEREDNVIRASVETTDVGIILDNFDIEMNSPENQYDLNFSVQSNFEASSSSYKIGDEYSYNDLRSKIEELGYTCK